MADELEQEEEDCERIRQENAKLLTQFKKWLASNRLATKTIDKHVSNVDFYINEFLLYEDAVPAAEGATHIGMFLGYWFIKKALWSSAAAIKSNAASLKKFYEFMTELGLVSAEELQEMRERIKEEMPEWLATMKRYDDPSITDPEDIWGL